MVQDGFLSRTALAWYLLFADVRRPLFLRKGFIYMFKSGTFALKTGVWLELLRIDTNFCGDFVG